MASHVPNKSEDQLHVERQRVGFTRTKSAASHLWAPVPHCQTSISRASVSKRRLRDIMAACDLPMLNDADEG
jgi:hypothetical protein